MSNCIDVAPEQVCYVHCKFCNTILEPQTFAPYDYPLDPSSSSKANKISHMVKQNEDSIAINRPPEKRQRVPSAYNQFIKEEIQRIKASNPEISHREAFSTAAKNWAHFPHIHFGLMLENSRKDKFDEVADKLLMTKAAVCNK